MLGPKVVVYSKVLGERDDVFRRVSEVNYNELRSIACRRDRHDTSKDFVSGLRLTSLVSRTVCPILLSTRRPIFNGFGTYDSRLYLHLTRKAIVNCVECRAREDARNVCYRVSYSSFFRFLPSQQIGVRSGTKEFVFCMAKIKRCADRSVVPRRLFHFTCERSFCIKRCCDFTVTYMCVRSFGYTGRCRRDRCGRNCSICPRRSVNLREGGFFCHRGCGLLVQAGVLFSLRDVASFRQIFGGTCRGPLF